MSVHANKLTRDFKKEGRSYKMAVITDEHAKWHGIELEHYPLGFLPDGALSLYHPSGL